MPNLDQLNDTALDEMIAKKRELLARAHALVAEDQKIVDQLATDLATSEIDESPLTAIEELQRLFAARTSHLNGRKGARVSAEHALAQVLAERDRRQKANAQRESDNARAALEAYACEIREEVSSVAATITTMLKGLRLRAQAARDADFTLRRVMGVTELPGQLRFFDPYADVAVLEQAGAGITEVTHTLARFNEGDLNAQVARKQAVEARERQQIAQRLAGEARERASA